MTQRRKIDDVTLREDTERVENLRKSLARAETAAQALRWVSKFVRPTSPAHEILGDRIIVTRVFDSATQNDRNDAVVFDSYLRRALDNYAEDILEEAIALAQKELSHGTEIHAAINRDHQRQMADQQRKNIAERNKT